MKVILVEDVKALGKKGEMVNVSDGYARNMLFPKKLALEASAKNINDLKLKKAHDEKVAKEQLADARAFAEELAKAQTRNRGDKHAILAHTVYCVLHRRVVLDLEGMISERM